MNSKDIYTSPISNQKCIRIKGHEYKVYPSGSIIDFEKASATLGNVLESKELLSKYHLEVLKLSILLNSTQDSKELTDSDFVTSEKRLYYFYKTLNNIEEFAYENRELNDSIGLHGRIVKQDIVDGIKVDFINAINDNFNTSLVISQFVQIFKYLNALLNNANENPLHKLTTLNKIHKDILSVANLLGLFFEWPEDFILGMKEKYIKLNNIDLDEVTEIMDLRQEAKLSKNYALSDELKAKLDQKGIIIRDSQNGYEWDIKALYL